MSHVKSLAEFQNLNFWHFFKVCNFDFVLFWLGFYCESLVWVIMGQRGVSECRHSSWSSWIYVKSLITICYSTHHRQVIHYFGIVDLANGLLRIWNVQPLPEPVVLLIKTHWNKHHLKLSAIILGCFDLKLLGSVHCTTIYTEWNL